MCLSVFGSVLCVVAVVVVVQKGGVRRKVACVCVCARARVCVCVLL